MNNGCTSCESLSVSRFHSVTCTTFFTVSLLSLFFISTRDSWQSKGRDHFLYQFPCWRLQCQSIEYHFGAKLHNWIFPTFPSKHYLFFILSKLFFMNVSKSFKSVTAECTILQKTSGNISFSFFFLRSVSMAVCAISFM